MHLVGLSPSTDCPSNPLRPRDIAIPSDHLHLHRGRYARSEVVEEDVAVEVGDSRRNHELVTAKVRQTPRTIRIEICVLIAHPEGKGPRRHRTDVSGRRPGIFFIRASGLNGFPFSIPMDANKPIIVDRWGGRLFLNDGIQQFPKRVVTGATKFAGMPDALANLMAGGFAASESW